MLLYEFSTSISRTFALRYTDRPITPLWLVETRRMVAPVTYCSASPSQLLSSILASRSTTLRPERNRTAASSSPVAAFSKVMPMTFTLLQPCTSSTRSRTATSTDARGSVTPFGGTMRTMAAGSSTWKVPGRSAERESTCRSRSPLTQTISRLRMMSLTSLSSR